MAKNIHYNLLKSVIIDTPEESKFDLTDTLDKISEIQPSEIFRNQS